MKKFSLILILIIFANKASATIKENIINKLKSTDNISFNFEQNINGKIENGKCIIKYPKKIYCDYNTSGKKLLVSNGKSLVIKTETSYYRYPLEKTPLNFILDKNYLLDRIKKIDTKIIDDKFININFLENDNEINIFFNKENYNLIGWQTMDIYQNLSITFLSSIINNQGIKNNVFILPSQN